MATKDEVIAPAMLKMPVCDAHRMIEESITEFLDANWGYFCLGFESAKCARPERGRTTWAWMPWGEAKAFWGEMEGDRLSRQYKQ